MISFRKNNYLKKIMVPAAVIVSVASLLSRFLGVVRDHLLTKYFGATREIPGMVSELDAYYAAFRIPDFLYQLLILGTVSAVFIPIFIQHLDKNKQKAWDSAANIVNIILVLMCTLSLFAFVFAPYIIRVFAFGFDTETFKLTVELTRIMILSPIIFGVSAIMGSILNTHHRFFAYSMAPILYNVGIIGGILFLRPTYGIHGVAWGIIIGAILHLLIQTVAAWKLGFRFKAMLNFKDNMLINMSSLALPRITATGASQINLLIDTAIASSLIAGSITVLNLAQNLQFLPVGLIGISVAISSFPILSGLVQNKETKKFDTTLSESIRKILFLIIPLTVAILLLRAEIVRLLFGSGEFNWHDTVLTANTFGIFAVSLFSQCIEPLLNRAFYAHKNTKTPLMITIVVVLTHIVLSILLAKILMMGVRGLALSFSISSVISFVLLIYYAKTKLNIQFKTQEIIISLVKITIAAIITAVVIQIAKEFFGSTFGELDRFYKVFYKLSLSTLAGFVAYALTTRILDCREWNELRKDWVKKS